VRKKKQTKRPSDKPDQLACNKVQEWTDQGSMDAVTTLDNKTTRPRFIWKKKCDGEKTKQIKTKPADHKLFSCLSLFQAEPGSVSNSLYATMCQSLL
jgi:hypothetical protein